MVPSHRQNCGPCGCGIHQRVTPSRLARGRGCRRFPPFSPRPDHGLPLRLRAEGRNNFKFDESRAGIDEGFVLPRFRRGVTWEPAKQLAGGAELQTLVRFPSRSRGGNAA